MNNTEYLVQDYQSHPAFSFSVRPYSVDLTKIDAFDLGYKRVANTPPEAIALFKKTKASLEAQVSEIFHEMKLQVQDDYEQLFLNELEVHSLRLLCEDLDLYQSANKEKYNVSSQEANARALKLDHFFFSKLGVAAVHEIVDVSLDEIDVLRSRAARGLLKREDLSTNTGAVISRIAKILNKDFKDQGVLEAVSAYMGRDYVVGGLALELSVPQTTWWRNTLLTNAPPKTMYAHFDESIKFPKAIVYLSDVGSDNGPTSCYPKAYEALRLNALQEIIGRVLSAVGSQTDSGLKDYYGKSYHQSMSSEQFRRHFMRLPSELRFNSHFGWDVLPGSDIEEKLLSYEQKMLGMAGTFIVFDGGRLLHRGGLLESGERIVLQVMFSPSASFFRRLISLPRKAVTKIWSIVK
jgi:hypothetical protein